MSRERKRGKAVMPSVAFGGGWWGVLKEFPRGALVGRHQSTPKSPNQIGRSGQTLK